MRVNVEKSQAPSHLVSMRQTKKHLLHCPAHGPQADNVTAMSLCVGSLCSLPLARCHLKTSARERPSHSPRLAGGPANTETWMAQRTSMTTAPYDLPSLTPHPRSRSHRPTGHPSVPKHSSKTPSPGIPCRSLIHSRLCDRLCS